ncbi:MAG TPA: HAMP domain-containing sensor histidine kinase [Polyangiaceae bacterium]|nr:HAMP domain-containing sensor histidine kinase [Polyangiaceae bacterium]
MAWTRERVLIVPLVGGVVLAVVVLATIMFRSSFQLEKLRERSVVEATLSLANDKADRLDKRIIEQDNVVASLTEGEGLDDFGQRWLEVAEAQTPTVRAILLVDVSEPSREVVAYASRSPGPDDDRFRRLLLQRIWPELALGGANSQELRHLHTALDAQSYLISHFERQVSGRLRILFVWHDVPRIVHDLFPVVYREAEGQQARLNVVDEKGRIVFGPPLSRGGLTLGRPFATTLYKWRVNVSVSGAEELAAAVERRRILEVGLVGLSSLVVVFGLLVIVVAADRERKLAALKSEFVANVSHELKTPLALVRMFSELLYTGRGDPEKQRKYLEIVVSESERLSALIDNVLDFARLERGKTSYEFREVDLADSVSRAFELCRGRAERQGVEPLLDLGEGPHPAHVDERAIEIATVNLIDNALKYAPGSRTVRVSLERDAREYRIAVSDQGPGIPVDERRRIFDRFVRGRSRPSGTERGSGIGLSLVEQIAQTHGGRAWVEDASKESPPGSRFVFTVRLGTR